MEENRQNAPVPEIVEEAKRPPKKKRSLGRTLIFIGLILLVLPAITGNFDFYGNIIYGWSWGPISFGSSPSRRPLERASMRKAGSFDIDELEVYCEAAKLTIKEGSDFDIESNVPNLIQEEHNGRLLIRSEIENKIRNFNSNNYELIITIPKRQYFDSVDIDAGMSSSKISGISASSINITNGMGSLDMSGIEADDLYIDNGLGSVTGKDISTDSLTIDNGLGSVNLSRTYCEDFYIDNGLGSVKLNLDSKIEEYSFNIEADLGTVKINDNNYGNGFYDSWDGDNSGIIKTGMGEVKIWFTER